MLQQLQQQAEQLQQELQKAQQQIQQYESKIQTLNEAKIQLEQEKVRKDSEIEWYKAKTDRTFKEESMELEQKKAEIEIQQLRDGNPYNDKIKMK